MFSSDVHTFVSNVVKVGEMSTTQVRGRSVAVYGKQSYAEIIKMCQEQGCLFEDPEFPAVDESLFSSRKPPRPFVWKRPPEISSDPQYVSGGASRLDIQQGMLGNAWFSAAVSSLACNPKLLNRVILPDQNFGEGSYYGVFRFILWFQDDWIEIVVDDRLPTYNNRLVFMNSADKNEFWGALLEKAYAKLNGCYESLKDGQTSEALIDFTGGLTEIINLKKPPGNVFNMMQKAMARGSLMGCSIEAKPNQIEVKLDNGLVMKHAYTVTSVKKLTVKDLEIELIRVRNPWGNEREWTGAWSDGSEEWKLISDEEKSDLGIVNDDDGEFWMSFKDWVKEFTRLEICNLGRDSLDEDDKNSGWEATAYKGVWIPRVSAGGCRNFIATFASNPQYRITLTDSDEDEEDLCTVLLHLMQKDRCKQKKKNLTMGYAIYKIEDNDELPVVGEGPLDTDYFRSNQSFVKPEYGDSRDMCVRHKLPTGTYVIVPSTFNPNEDGEFLLRFFTEKLGSSSELGEGTKIIENQPH